jgi:hypothetical protein
MAKSAYLRATSLSLVGTPSATLTNRGLSLGGAGLLPKDLPLTSRYSMIPPLPAQESNGMLPQTDSLLRDMAAFRAHFDQWLAALVAQSQERKQQHSEHMLQAREKLAQLKKQVEEERMEMQRLDHGMF